MKKFLLIFLAIFISSSIFAFDFGGAIANDFSTEHTDKIILHENFDCSLWLKLPLDFQGNTLLNFEAAYLGNLNQQNKFITYFDVRKLNIRMKIPLSTKWFCTFLMGRNYFSDLSSLIYNDKLDQLTFDFDFGATNISFIAGYTGFLNGYTHKTFYPNNQVLQTKYYSPNESTCLIIDGKLVLDNFFDFSPFSIELLNILNLKIQEQSKLFINVNVAKNLSVFHSIEVFTSFLLKSQVNSPLANFTKAHFSYKKNNNEFLAKVLFASNSSDKLSDFEPYVASSLSKIVQIPLSSVISLGGTFNHSLTTSTLVSLDANMFYNLLPTTSELMYNGTELAFFLKINPTSDFAILFGFGDYLDKNKKNVFYFDTSIKLVY